MIIDVCIAIKTQNVFDLNFLAKLRSLHDELESTVPYLVDITSLINARHIRSESDTLIVEELFETWPQTQEELTEIKHRTYGNPLYINTLITEDGKYTTILLETEGFTKSAEVSDINILEDFENDLDLTLEEPKKTSKKQFMTSSERSEIVMQVYKVIKKYEAPDFEIYISGSRAVEHYVSTALMHDMVLFSCLSVSIVIIILSIMFKRITGIILPLLVAALSLLSTFGLMVFFKEPLTLTSQILPAFLMAVGVGYVIHVLSIFYRKYDENENKEEAIVFTFSHSGVAIVLTGVTTACGLLSFITADLAPVKSFGIFSSAGVIFALIYTMMLIPSTISIIPIKTKKSIDCDKRKARIIDPTLTFISKFTVTHPFLIILISIVILIFSIMGIMNIRFGHDIIRWMPKDSVIRNGTEKIDEVLYGTNVLYVMIDFKQKDALYEPNVLNKFEASKEYFENLKVGPIYVGKAWSVTSILKEINQALHNGLEKHYSIPNSKNLISQEFLLFENSGYR